MSATSLVLLCVSVCSGVGDRQAATGPNNCTGHFLLPSAFFFFMRAKLTGVMLHAVIDGRRNIVIARVER